MRGSAECGAANFARAQVYDVTLWRRRCRHDAPLVQQGCIASNFSSKAYIADLRTLVPLDTLSTEVRSHLGLLKGELMELINKDYADFVNLSMKLVDVDGAVLCMCTPLGCRAALTQIDKKKETVVQETRN